MNTQVENYIVGETIENQKIFDESVTIQIMNEIGRG
jgi:hypothetical protein